MSGLLCMQVGNWSRWLSDMIGIDGADSLQEDQHNSEGDDRRRGDTKSFLLLNDLSDLLMLPKDMLMDPSIRKEVDLTILLLLHLKIIL